MRNIFLITLEPLENRYTAQWKRWIPNYFHDFNVIEIDGEIRNRTVDTSSFLNWNETNIWKSQQIEKIAHYFNKSEVKNNDVFLFYDAWHYGAIALSYMAKMNGIDITTYGMWHAGLYDKNDLVTKSGLNENLLDFEKSLLKTYDYNFVATKYHKKLILDTHDINPEKIQWTGFPYEFSELDQYKNDNPKNSVMVFPHRISPEKRYDLFKSITNNLDIVDGVVCQEVCTNKDEYFKLLSTSKYVFSANKQETWGIGTFEAMYLGCIPIIPNTLSYDEMYFDEFKYDDKADKFSTMHKIISSNNEYKLELLDANIEFLQDKYCTFKNIKRIITHGHI